MTALHAEDREQSAPLQQRITFHYSKLANWIDSRSWYHDDHIVRTVTSCILGNPKSVLELCCGSGLLLEALGSQLPDAEIIGLDISPRMTELASERVAHQDNVSVIAGDWIYQLPHGLKQKQFDLIVVKNALHLLDDLPRKLCELKKISHSKTNLIIVETVSPTIEANKFIQRLFKHVDTDNIKQTYFTRLSLPQMLRESGWEIALPKPRFVRQYINVEDWLIHKCDDLFELAAAKRILKTQNENIRRSLEFDSDNSDIPTHMLRLQYISSHVIRPLEAENKQAMADEIGGTQLHLIGLTDK